MKKFVSIVLAFVLAMSLSVSALAAPNGFVESPSTQKGPEIIEGDNVIITPFGDRDKLPDDVRENLENAYNSILNSDNLGQLSEALEELAKQIGVPVENLVVSELFELSPEDATNDGNFTVTLKDESFKNFFALMKYENGKWVLIDDAKLKESTNITFATGKLPAPFAVVVNTEGTSGDSDSEVPATGDNTNVLGVVAICFGSLAVLVAAFFVFKKREA